MGRSRLGLHATVLALVLDIAARYTQVGIAKPKAIAVVSLPRDRGMEGPPGLWLDVKKANPKKKG